MSTGVCARGVIATFIARVSATVVARRLARDDVCTHVIAAPSRKAFHDDARDDARDDGPGAT